MEAGQHAILHKGYSDFASLETPTFNGLLLTAFSFEKLLLYFPLDIEGHVTLNLSD